LDALSLSIGIQDQNSTIHGNEIEEILWAVTKAVESRYKGRWMTSSRHHQVMTLEHWWQKHHHHHHSIFGRYLILTSAQSSIPDTVILYNWLKFIWLLYLYLTHNNFLSTHVVMMYWRRKSRSHLSLPHHFTSIW